MPADPTAPEPRVRLGPRYALALAATAVRPAAAAKPDESGRARIPAAADGRAGGRAVRVPAARVQPAAARIRRPAAAATARHRPRFRRDPAGDLDRLLLAAAGTQA